jgi:hypothetical protein
MYQEHETLYMRLTLLCYASLMDLSDLTDLESVNESEERKIMVSNIFLNS